ncbi:hypothetical protein DFH05DRAFT_1481203 [Lentinula detonsa]|uniref:Ribosomal RNA methyltransferase FtsJ domain-containing protein n=1 Tax=Lentinula detonsa TaxID=2804962 RepID=A0A9W8P6D0_9AGAR|nr:hypothetical protein DFH05DRAFT_1481203 [Lentinula detonsa]
MANSDYSSSRGQGWQGQRRAGHPGNSQHSSARLEPRQASRSSARRLEGFRPSSLHAPHPPSSYSPFQQQDYNNYSRYKQTLEYTEPSDTVSDRYHIQRHQLGDARSSNELKFAQDCPSHANPETLDRSNLTSKPSGHAEYPPEILRGSSSLSSHRHRHKELVHWDEALARLDLEMGGTATLTEEVIACGATELKEIFEIWKELSEKARQEGTMPKLDFQKKTSGSSSVLEAKIHLSESSQASIHRKERARESLLDPELSQQCVFEEIVNRFSRLFPKPHHDDAGYYFLDLGCRLGGFASFLLRRNQYVTGVGICPVPPNSLLDVERTNKTHNAATVASELQTYYTRHQTHYSAFSSRFQLHFLDMTRLDLRLPAQKYCQGLSHTNSEFSSNLSHSVFNELGNSGPADTSIHAAHNTDLNGLDLEKPPKELLFGPKQISNNRHITAGTSSQKFNLVVLDNYPSSSDLLLISQLLLAFQSLIPNRGGTLVVRLRHPESVVTAKILYLLDTLSFTVAALKPRDMVGDSEDPGCFYAIAQDVGGGPHGHKLLAIIEELRKLWWRLLMRSVPSRLLLESASAVDSEKTELAEMGEIVDDNEKSPGPATRERSGLREEDLDFIIYTHELKGDRCDYLSRLAVLGEMVWTRQLEMILSTMKNDPPM